MNLYDKLFLLQLSDIVYMYSPMNVYIYIYIVIWTSNKYYY